MATASRLTRMAVYNRNYSGVVWTVQHNMSNDRLLVQVFDTDYNTVMPSRIQKISTNLIEAEFDGPCTGSISIFKITPTFRNRSIDIVNQTGIVLNHQINSPNFVFQFWNSDGSIAFPRHVEKLDSRSIHVLFEEAFTGYVEIMDTKPVANSPVLGHIKRDIENPSILWSFRYHEETDPKHVTMIHNYPDGKMMMPSRETRLETNRNAITDNKAESQWHTEGVTGTIYALAHGYRI